MVGRGPEEGDPVGAEKPFVACHDDEIGLQLLHVDLGGARRLRGVDHKGGTDLAASGADGAEVK
eukprot:9805226-Alexandrium_andersonii.AAC.1